MSQRHDIGWQKRHRELPARKQASNPQHLALRLVERGLAPAAILGPMRMHYGKGNA